MVKEAIDYFIIITAADANYFDLVQGTILSIRDKPEGEQTKIGFLDLGCTSEQLEWLQTQVNFIQQPEWEFDFPDRESTPEYLKGLLVRPFLRKYFPGFEVYFWIDADAWVQDWRAVELYLQGAKKRGMAIATDLYRTSSHIYENKQEILQIVHYNYQVIFGQEVANKYYDYVGFNAGVFALHHNAPHWEAWAESLDQGLQNNASILTDQYALNLAIYEHGLLEKTELLPSWCNWLCHSYRLPAWSRQINRFVEPQLPHPPIGIIHLSDIFKDIGEVETLTTNGDYIELDLKYEISKSQLTQASQSELDLIGNISKSQILDPLVVQSSNLEVENHIIVTAADAHFFDLVQGTILSIREKAQGENTIIGFLDLGCTSEQVKWLQDQVNFIQKPEWEFDFPNRHSKPNYLKGLLARPFLKKYFPGFEVYLWIDADAWVQDWRAVELYIQGAKKQGLAIAHDVHRSSKAEYGFRQYFHQFQYLCYESTFGREVAEKLSYYPILNAGIFALHENAPHWDVWSQYLVEASQNTVSLYTDQLVLNFIVYTQGLFEQTEILPEWCNWHCNTCLPAWDEAQRILVSPYLPHEPLGIIHLTATKYQWLRLVTTDNHQKAICLRYLSPEQKSASFDSDYISPNLQMVYPDSHFPNLAIGDTRNCPWEYLRQDIPHHWYVDRRHPVIGFASRDEAHILYNSALQVKGKKVLEIGCWMGWSACHLALAGVELDVIDPLLANPDIYASVSGSLESAGVMKNVNLIPGYSPQEVDHLGGEQQRQWDLIFIDGNHDAPGPLNDAIACAKYAAPDALILFHDLASPDVAQGLDYLRDQGWRTMVYQTMQIMGVAWRGNARPILHDPDPRITWKLPKHLQTYLVSSLTLASDLEEFQALLPTVRPYTLLSEARLFSLYSLAKQVCVQDLPGNFVECGTCRGGSAALLAWVIQRYSQRPRLLYAFDTFAGMPDPTDEDRSHGIPANETGFVAGSLSAPIAEYLDRVCQLLTVQDLVMPVPGMFADTLPEYKTQIGQIAFLHADGDWYSSTMEILNHLYDQVVPQGMIQVDDYGHWEGCKKALHDFEQQRGESFDLQPIDYTGVWFQKIDNSKFNTSGSNMQQRNWKTSLPPQTLYSIQDASLNYSYRGIRMVKNPFDFALYPLLLWQIKPRTIIEIGSFQGGSALWLGDVFNNFDIDGHIYSIDVNQVTAVSHPRVTFLQGSGRNLQEVLTPDFLDKLPRPLLVIEDADHFYETTLKVLEFFHSYLHPGEYIIIEDGIISDLGSDYHYNGGPNRALQEFLSVNGDEYEIDQSYCDFFGNNVTWCINGFLKKIPDRQLTSLHLRTINLIIFPNWQQAPEQLLTSLQDVLGRLFQHPQKQNITLLISSQDIPAEEADLIISTATMNLLMEEDVDTDNLPEISFISGLEPQAWKRLIPCLEARLSLQAEDEQLISNSGAAVLPVYPVDELNSSITSSLS